MNKYESKYFNTALLMNEALIKLLDKKDYEYISVKELCNKAGVNRSTFYLHYDSMDELLEETVENINKRFYDSFGVKAKNFKLIADSKDLVLINKDYLEPYLNFIKNNKIIFKLSYDKPDVLKSNINFGNIYSKICVPILEHFNVPQKERKYLVYYYMEGIMSVIKIWLDNDCFDSIDYIMDLILKYTDLTGKY